MAIDAKTLLSEGRCYACVGISQATQLRLALLRRISLASNPANDVSATGLMTLGAPLQAVGVSQAQRIELALYSQIAA